MNGDILTNRSSLDRSKTEYYPTPKEVTQALMQHINPPKGLVVWEPACGTGDMSCELEKYFSRVISTDINDWGYGEKGVDFLTAKTRQCDWIITNPPFSISEEFIRKCIEFNKPFALLLKSQYWHAKKRMALFNDFRPVEVLPLTWRPDFLNGQKGGAPTMECLWTVWGTSSAKTTNYTLLEKPKQGLYCEGCGSCAYLNNFETVYLAELDEEGER